MNNKNDLLCELCSNQRDDINENYKLEIGDLARFTKGIDKSIFNSDECVLWKDYEDFEDNEKPKYVNFYLKKKKLSLHRILYINFIDCLEKNSYLKYTCDNQGICCNLKHIIKTSDKNKKEEAKEENEEEGKKLIIDFDD